MITIRLASVFVDDQEKALRFYTGMLGFVKKHDIPLGEFRWLTVISPGGPEGIELLLEPNANPASKVFQKAIFDQGIPATGFAVDDIRAEYERMKALGVEFVTEPVKAGGGPMIAVFRDTCGNLIQLFEG